MGWGSTQVGFRNAATTGGLRALLPGLSSTTYSILGGDVHAEIIDSQVPQWYDIGNREWVNQEGD